MTERALDLQSAAERLGVHYQTAYGWVRSGRLPARKLKGSYVLEAQVVERLAAERSRPRRPPPRRPRGGFTAHADRAYEALMAGEETAVRRLIGSLTASGVTLTRCAEEVLGPAMRRIGEDWSNGAASILLEHRASAIAERVLAEHQPAGRGRRRGTAAVASMPGDRHDLPTLMATLALREDGWTVHHLGAEVPPRQLERFCREQGVHLAVLTVTVSEAHEPALRSAGALERLGVRVLVGHSGARLEELQRQAREQLARLRSSVG